MRNHDEVGLISAYWFPPARLGVVLSRAMSFDLSERGAPSSIATDVNSIPF